jgi:psiF repeat
MSLRDVGLRWLGSVVLGTIAPLVLAQMGPAGVPGGRGHGHDSPAAQDCRKQAEAQKLPAGEERQTFMRRCLESKSSSSDAAKAEAARAKMSDPASGHLHSEPPAAPTTPPGS